MKRTPYISGMNKAEGVGKNVLRERIHEEADDLLISRDPIIIG